MDLVEHFRIIAHNWWRILLVALLVAGGVYAWSSQKSSVYESDAFMSVTSGGANVGAGTAKDDVLFLGATYAQLATTKPVLARAIVTSKLPIKDVSTAQSRVSASASTDVGFLTITGQGPTPTDASSLANAVAKSLITEITQQQDAAVAQDLKPVDQEITQIQQQLDQPGLSSQQVTTLQQRYASLVQAEVQRRTQPRDRVSVLSRATPSLTAVSPKPVHDARARVHRRHRRGGGARRRASHVGGSFLGRGGPRGHRPLRGSSRCSQRYHEAVNARPLRHSAHCERRS